MNKTIKLIFWVLSIVLLFILFFIIGWVISIYFHIHLLPVTDDNELHNLQFLPHNELAVIYYLAIVILTLALLIIAAIQLTQISKTVSSDYLLKIDERYHSKNSVKARKIIHDLYIEANPDSFHHSQVLWNAIGEKIRDLRLNKKKIDEFICLKDYLDFFETLGFLYEKKKITKEEVYGLLGYSLIKFYEIFDPYIQDRRRRKNDNELYCEFEKLYNVIKNPKKHHCCILSKLKKV